MFEVRGDGFCGDVVFDSFHSRCKHMGLRGCGTLSHGESRKGLYRGRFLRGGVGGFLEVCWRFLGGVRGESTYYI